MYIFLLDLAQDKVNILSQMCIFYAVLAQDKTNCMVELIPKTRFIQYSKLPLA